MTEYKKVFLDTSPIVYYLEKSGLYYPKMKKFWNDYKNCDYVTSAVTVTEYLTYPYRQNNIKLINAFYAFADGMDIEIKSIGKSRDKVRESFAAQGQQRFPAAARARQGQEVKLPVHAHDHRDLFFLIKIFPRDIFQKKFMQVFF